MCAYVPVPDRRLLNELNYSVNCPTDDKMPRAARDFQVEKEGFGAGDGRDRGFYRNASGISIRSNARTRMCGLVNAPGTAPATHE